MAGSQNRRTNPLRWKRSDKRTKLVPIPLMAHFAPGERKPGLLSKWGTQSPPHYWLLVVFSSLTHSSECPLGPISSSGFSRSSAHPTHPPHHVIWLRGRNDENPMSATASEDRQYQYLSQNCLFPRRRVWRGEAITFGLELVYVPN